MDDGSSDETLARMRELSRNNAGSGICPSPAISARKRRVYAGLTTPEANSVSLMDVDLQDPPALIPQMLDI